MSTRTTRSANFLLRGEIVDIDETIPDQPHHPSSVVLVDAHDEIMTVIVPASVLGDKLPLLCAGRPIQRLKLHVPASCHRHQRLVASPVFICSLC